MNLSKAAKITQAVTPTAGAAGVTTINGTTLDMQNYEGVLIVVTMGAILATAVTSIKAQQGAAANLSDAADLLGSGQAIAVADAEKVFYIDLFRPTKRYVRVVVLRATANATVASVEYIQYGAKKEPTTHGTNVAGETHVSPAEGAA